MKQEHLPSCHFLCTATSQAAAWIYMRPFTGFKQNSRRRRGRPKKHMLVQPTLVSATEGVLPLRRLTRAAAAVSLEAGDTPHCLTCFFVLDFFQVQVIQKVLQDLLRGPGHDHVSVREQRAHGVILSGGL